MKQSPPFKLSTLKESWSKLDPYKAPTIFGIVVIAFFLLFTVGRYADWTGVGDDETVATAVKTFKTDSQGKAVEETTTTTTPQSGKTLWDILSLIGVPASLAFFGWWLQQLQEQRSKKQAEYEEGIAGQKADHDKLIAQSNQNEEALQSFIDRIAELLIKERLMAIATKIQLVEKQARQNKGKVESDAPQPDTTSNPVVNEDGTAEVKPASKSVVNEVSKIVVTDEERDFFDMAKDVVQARTLSILRRLGDDLERKSAVIRFLADADVIEKVGLDLSGFDLRGINFEGANLKGIQLTVAQLEGANLSKAILEGAKLEGADLSKAILEGAKLEGADLTSANLHYANLTSANLTYANLHYANLTNAELFCAILRYAILRHTTLNDVDLNDVDIIGAILLAIDLQYAEGLTPRQLEEGYSFLCNVVLPNEITNIEPNRDCDKLAQVLHGRYCYRYPEFETLESAESSIEFDTPYWDTPLFDECGKDPELG